MLAMDPPPVQYVTTTDGVSIAYAVSGDGSPFVFMPTPFTHVQSLWQENHIRPWLEGLAARFRLIQYDCRGKGMSSRGLPPDLTLEDCCLDLAAVVQRLELSQYVLLSSAPMSCYEAIHHVIENPGQVRALVLASPIVHGDAVPRAWIGSFAEENWDAFIRSLAGFNRESDLEMAVARMKQATTQEDWLTRMRIAQEINLENDLPRVTTPTLVLHPRDYLLPVEESMKVAAAIPNARFVLVDGTSPRGDPAVGLKAIEEFLASLPAHDSSPTSKLLRPDGLSAREVEVLRLIARGRSNPQIALELVISVNTVQSHVSSILAKTGLANRAEASSYAQRRGLGPE
jgi:DNA-binding CsgD family transcriptional regulator/pimeloyl-ACP methyl ester carboxylesterase